MRNVTRRKDPSWFSVIVGLLFEAGCFLQLIGLAIAFTMGFFATRYDIWMIFGKETPLLPNLIGALFAAVTVPVSIIVWVLSLCHVAFPLVK